MYDIPAPAAPWLSGRALRRWLPLLLLPVLLLALVAPAATGATAASQAAADRMLPQLARDSQANPEQQFRVIVQRIPDSPWSDTVLNVVGGTKLSDLPGDALVAFMPGQALQALSRNPSVAWITYDAPVASTSFPDLSTTLGAFYPQAVRAPGLWVNGVTGRGVGVAVIDTGINKDLPDFQTADGGTRIPTRQAFVSANISRLDKYGHGTHIAGIIGGNSLYSLPVGSKQYVGIAPEVNLIDVTVAGDDGVSYISDVVLGIEWVIKERQTYNIRVMNLSLVSTVAESYTTSVLAAAVERAWFNGIFVVVSAGNGGANSMLYPPANDPFVVTVGASDMKSTATRLDDGMAPWSSYGTTQDGFNKPDVVAPGRVMAAPIAYPDATLVTQDRIVDPNRRYFWLSGTSMSAPVVAGGAALIFQVRPELTNDQVKWLLMNTAFVLTSNGSALPGQGAGLIDAARAVNFRSRVQFANQGLTPSSLLVVADGSTNYSSANWSTANWSTANWSTANWSTANWSTANWSTANWSTSTTLR